MHHYDHMKKSIPNIHLLLFLLLVAMLQTTAVFLRAPLNGAASTQALVFSFFALMALVNALGYSITNLLAPRWPIPRKLFLSNGILTVLVIVLAYHFWLFNQHVNVQNIELAIEGIVHGEAGLDAEMIGKILGGIAIVFMLIWALAYGIWRLFGAPERTPNLGLLIAAILLLNGVGLAWRSVMSVTDTSYEVHAFIPWISFLPQQQLPVALELEPPVHRIGMFEREQIKRLVELKPHILAGEITASSTPNILFVHVESLRWDIFNADNMPHLTARAVDTLQVLPTHFTTGANTGTGMNGLLNGLSGSHYQAVRHFWFKPLTLAMLQKLGYRTNVYASRHLGYEDLGELFFEDAHAKLVLINEGDIAQSELSMTERYIADLQQDRGAPRLDYLMYYATHYDYFFPEIHAKYLPVQKLGFDIRSGRNEDKFTMRDGLFNRYRNSAHFVDELINRIVLYLKNSGRLHNTIVVITGDHGEEFWEHGTFGHTHGLVNEQIRVPALVYFPQPLSLRYTVTSHQDFMPTIFDAMQVRSTTDKCGYMSGRSLYSYNAVDDYVVASLGVTRKNTKFTEMLIGSGYKVKYEFKDELRILGVYDMEDRPLAQFNDTMLRDLIVRAIEAKRRALGNCDSTAPAYTTAEFRQD